MADAKISALPVATALSGVEILPVVQGGATVGATVDQVMVGLAPLNNPVFTGILTSGAGASKFLFAPSINTLYASLTAGNVTPSYTNYTLQSESNYTTLNGAIQTGLAIQGNIVLTTASTGVSVTGKISSTGVAKLSNGYTVAALPVGTVGQRAYVTDALTPTYGATVAGGGAVVIPVFFNGTAWIVG